ncbi:NAD(P)/FAD-dependent oxidoreductase [Halorubellus sp. JP-L1]|uniref:FAD-dependent oxidoreductase n=1 Tax=Halorubellus sp. JP-L1 TaxID=2715753 RepID=UPI0014076F98|nr:FAD-dependent oxidoreductase [Halorubellus sp. JP-L1]NHN41099.1 NAD(P)/FAD-dependent oxidoreductase [Halorubellus sp. JP-L1]
MTDDAARGTDDASGGSDDVTADATAHRDVVVVGGGPAGSAVAVFTARYGLDTTVFDRGNGALPRCAYLENYPGFPGGIDVDVFRDLLAAHLKDAGAALVPDHVVSVERPAEDGPFVVETQDDRRVAADAIVAAAWYDGSHLDGLDDDEMFEAHEHHGEVEERFDPEYADADGRTPIDGLYVASPAGSRSAQAIVAAGNGAHVARSLLADRRRDRGYTGGLVPEYDWVRRDAEFSGEWADRDRWREWYENETDDDADVSPERHEELREAYVDEAFETRVTDEEAERRAEAGLERFVEVVGHDRVLDAVDDDAIHEYVDDTASSEGSDAGATSDDSNDDPARVDDDATCEDDDRTEASD